MSKKVLNDLKLQGNGCSTYLCSVAGVLEGAGLWDEEFYKMAGMTGMAFHFIVHKQLCPSSVTVYEWQNEHFAMIDRIGIESEVFTYHLYYNLNTFEKVQELAVERIKDSIDRGRGVVVWAPTPILEFGIISGYDDNDGVFYVKDCTMDDVDPLLYSNLGKVEVPILSYQLFYDRVSVDEQSTVRSSLEFGIQEWNKEYHVSPDYYSGRKGYQAFIEALEKEDYDPFGLSYIIFSYHMAKECLEEYLTYLAARPEYSDLGKTAELYKDIAANFRKMAELVPFNGPGTEIDKGVVPQVIPFLRNALELEDKAMRKVKEFLNK